MARMTKAQQAEKEQAIERLRERIKPGMEVGGILRRVASSGMSRCISVYHDGENITHDVCVAIGGSFSKEGWIRVGGCGMDVLLSVVYELGYTLFPHGFGCIGRGTEEKGFRDGCCSNDHANGDRDYTPHSEEGGCHHWHTSGGYAIRYSWI